MIGELIATGVTFGTGRKAINSAFSGTAVVNNIILDSGANFSGGTGGGLLLSGGTDLYDIFIQGTGYTSANLWSASEGTESIIANNGTGNIAGGSVAIVGGYGNFGSGDYSFIGGGYINSATTNYAIVVGGSGNLASGNRSFIGAGSSNTASGSRSTVGNGALNVASGTDAFVVGSGNTVSGNYSAAIGGQSIGGAANNTVYMPNARLAETTGSAIFSAGTDLYSIFAPIGAAESTTASNGLTKTGDNITLGGALTANTTIDAVGNKFSITSGETSFIKGTSSEFNLVNDRALYVENRAIVASAVSGLIATGVLQNLPSGDGTTQIAGSASSAIWNQSTTAITLSKNVSLVGLQARAFVFSAGTADWTAGVVSKIGASDVLGTIGKAIGLKTQIDDTNAGVITEFRGMFIPDMSGASGTIPSANLRYGIYQADAGNNYFAGMLEVDNSLSANTMYTDEYMDLNPQTVLPTALTGRMFFSGSPLFRIMYNTGGTSVDWIII